MNKDGYIQSLGLIKMEQRSMLKENMFSSFPTMLCTLSGKLCGLFFYRKGCKEKTRKECKGHKE